ncbi:peptide/nickel transport system substrate-binding protein [Paenibacillus sp. UNCCL117]|uniref:ABC transporter substrate-binding protein n=1 Tax=unclassified Paenibacillus TaxID=185978 RepID=UPI0008920D78|nr:MULTISPECIES: ABC transporter substrate-binding protein [unclassified Paenibacillus]SDE28444.1 peptide/nickel transport system substrate-binding protein [Paenibacillus sp. cl123]SFW63479.1 peptide/nickel transport system substrate-binding protein [Paenibacillus sp. UNCCL117]
MKKSIIQTAAAVLAISLLLAGCADRADQRNAGAVSADGKPEAQAVTPGGELIWALGGVVTSDNLDAHKAGNAQNGRVMRSLYDSLVVELPDYTIKPWLATSWKLSDDKKSYTFELRNDVKFHDGTPFNAEAVKFNFDRIKDPATKASISLTEIGPYVSTEVLGEYTVRINFSSPFAPFLSNAAKVDLGFVSPTAVRKYGDRYPQNPVGTGPFKLVKLTPGAQVDFEKNPDYNWAPAGAGHQGPAYLDKLTVKYVNEEATRVSVLQSKQVHVADIIPPQNLLAFKSDKNFNVQQTELLQANHTYYFNLQKEPWNDLNVRKAVRAALDLETAVKTVYLGTSKQAWAPLSTKHYAYTPSLENSWKYDLKYANDTLEQLGWIKGGDGYREKNGKRLTIEFIDTQGNREKRLDLNAVMTQQLKQAGIELKLVNLPAGTYSERRLKREYDFVAASQFSGDASVLRQLYSTKGTSGKDNIASTQDPQLEQWLEEALVETDPAKNKEIYKKVQEHIIENVYTIPTYVFDYTVASVKEVRGITFDYPAWPVFYDAWIQK